MLTRDKIGTQSDQAAMEEQKCGNGRAEMWQWKSRKVTVKEQKNAFRRAKFVQVAMEELISGNGRAEMWQWKSRKVPLEELKLAKRQWKSRKVAMEEQKSGNGRAGKCHWKSKTWPCSKAIGRADLSLRKSRKLGLQSTKRL